MKSVSIRLALAILAFSSIAPLQAQNANATIKGTVTDPSGAAVAGAAVELINIGTGEHRRATSSSSGSYDFTALPPGEYSVKATASGFSEWSGRLTLRVSQEAAVNPSLTTASVSTSVNVTDVTPVITTEQSSLSDVKEATRIESLPLQSRNFLNILNFTPGVVSNNFAGQGQGYTRVNGIPGGSIDYLVDGMTASELYTNELQRLPQALPTIQELKVSTSNANAEYSRAGMVEVVTKSGTNQFHGQLFELNQSDALAAKSFHQQFVSHLVRNEYGGNLAGPVWFPKLYDGRDKTFFFFDAEGIKQRNAASESYIVPQANWKKGDFSNYTDDSGNLIKIYDPLTTKFDPATKSYVRTQFPGNIIPQNRLNPAGVKVASYVPNPNINIPYYDGQNYQNPNATGKDDRTLITAKIDQVLGANRLSGRYTYTDENNFGPKYFLNPNVRLLGGHNAAISFTELIKPNLINEIRGGVQRFHAYRGPQPINPPITQTLGLPTYPGSIAWPGISFPDYWTSSGQFDGIDRDNPQDAPNLTMTASDNLSWNHGKHEVKFGFFYQRSNVNTFETGQPGGDYGFSGSFTGLMDPVAAAMGTLNSQVPNTGAGLADMLLGYVDFAGLNQYPRFYTRQSDYAGYVQDNWKVNRRLTVNAGLRYEYWTPFRDKRNQASTLDLNAAGGPVVVYAGSGPITSQGFPQDVVDAYTRAGLRFESAKQAGLPNSLWNMQKNNFAPRMGAAFQLDDNTVIRGAYGIYDWVMPLVQYHQNTRRNPPFSYSYQSLVDNNDATAAELVFPVGPSTYANQSPNARIFGSNFITPSALSISKGGGWAILPWDTNYKTQMAQEWNFTLERRLPYLLGARVSYVGTHASNQIDYDPINAPAPRELSAPGATTPQRRLYPDFASSSTGAMDLLRYIGYSNSHQFQTELKRNYSNGIVLQAFYTFQRTLTTAEGANNSFGGLELLPAALTGNAPTSQRLRAIYADDSGLPRHNLSFNFNYELPFGKGKTFLSNSNGVVSRLVSGWNSSMFYYWRSGLFFSPYYNARGSNTILAPGKTGILPSSQRQAANWFDASVQRADLGQPYAGQTFIRRANLLDGDFLNNIPRNYMTGPGFYNIDSSFYKVTRLNEHASLRIEAQIFNLLNHKNFGMPNSAGVINAGVGPPRIVQFQGRIDF
ncbi:MAG: TonB-dependent receptor [Acidobacteriota bacterium]|nr:TonB-dependent receptor [Acidobacteriota bacterium]